MQRMYTPMASSAWLIDKKQKNPMAFQISAGARNPHRKKNPSKWNSEKVYPSPVYLHFKNSLSPSAKPQGSNISKMRGGWSWFIFPLCSGQSCKICLVCVCARARYKLDFRSLTYLPFLEITLSNSSPSFISFNQTQEPFIKQNFYFCSLASKLMKLYQWSGQASEISILRVSIGGLIHTFKYQILP